MRRFLLMGLPATGKTTTLIACVEYFKQQRVDANLVLTDTSVLISAVYLYK